MNPNWIKIGAISAAFAVVCGAFGSHGLKDRVSPEDLEIWRTAVLYHLVHAVALVGYGVFARTASTLTPGALFTGGTAIFSGSLYAMVLGGPRFLGAITPIGGVLLVLGWVLLARDAHRAAKAA